MPFTSYFSANPHLLGTRCDISTLPYYLHWKEEERLFPHIRELPARECRMNIDVRGVEGGADIQIESPQVPLIILAEID